MHRNKYGTLIVLYPKLASSLFLDAGSHEKKKDYTHIKMVLHDALNGFVYQGGNVTRPNIRRGKNAFRHRLEFPCIKKAPGSMRDAWYIILQMREYLMDEELLRYPSACDKWAVDMANASDATIRKEFARIEQDLAGIICRDVSRGGGIFHLNRKPTSNTVIETLIEQQGDYRPFNSLEGCRPFPPKPKEKPSKEKS